VKKEVDADSFFTFFKTVLPKEGGKGDEDDEGDADEDLERLQINHDIALTIQEEIVPYHLEYYLGLRTGDEDYPGMDFDEDENDDDDDDEDDAPKGKKKGPAAKEAKGIDKGAKGGEAKPECKQQ